MSGYLIIGAGAIGGVVAARLAAAGNDVTIADINAEHVRAIAGDGLRIGGAAELHAHPRAVVPGELSGDFDTVLICVKARASAEAIATAGQHVGDASVVAALQNGLAYQPVREAFGDDRTLAATISIGATFERPGHVTMTGPGSLHIGTLSGEITPRLKGLAAELAPVCAVHATDNVLGNIWSKLALFTVYVATATTDEEVLHLYRNDEDRALFTRIVAEVARLAVAEGVRLEPVDGFDLNVFLADDEAAILDAWQAQIAAWENYSQVRSGIWRDLAVHKRQTEAVPVLTPLIDIGRRHNLPTDHLREILKRVQSVESGRVPRGRQQLDALKAVAAENAGGGEVR